MENFNIDFNVSSLITPFCQFDREFHKSVFNSDVYQNNLFIVQQNIRSLRKNFDLFLVHLESFVNKPDVIFLTEIWIFDHEKEFFYIPGYKMYAKCNNSYASGGTAVFIKEGIECEYSSFDLLSCDMLKISLTINSI